MIPEYAIIVKNKTRFEALIERFNTKAQAKFYIERMGGDFREYELEHEKFLRALYIVQTKLTKIIKYKIVERQYLPSYIFSDKNLIVVIGQDGLVANTAKYSRELPIIAVNPDKRRYDGVLLPFEPSNFMQGVEAVMSNQSKVRIARFAEATLNDGQRLLAFNDLFIGAASHVSARYKISYGHETEEQSSSGIIVSTRAGATGWLSSIFNMAAGLVGASEESLEIKQPQLADNELLFAVREPFISVKTHADIVVGRLNEQTQLTVQSFMPTNGVIFSDGIESDFLKFNSGSIATIGMAKETAQLIEK